MLSSTAHGESGAVSFIWHKTARVDLIDICANPGAASCSITVDNVCHIYAPDNEQSFPYLGREFYACANQKANTAKRGSPGEVMTVNYILVAFRDSDHTCIRYTNYNTSLPFRVRGASQGRNRNTWKTGCWVEERNLIIALFPNELGLASTLGHELKHKVDGLWHGSKGEVRQGAFKH